MPTFVYEFGSPSLSLYLFLGLTLVGFGLGLAFWLDFRRRYRRGGRLAGSVVLIAGTLMGAGFGYLAGQPKYFKDLSVDAQGMSLEYGFPASRVWLPWHEIEEVEMRADRLVLTTRDGTRYRSPVVYRGEQEQLMHSIKMVLPESLGEG